ncbi:hypothetical protein Tco_0857369, partial [Tanacetum coccineum]
MRALYSSHIACFQLGSRRAWKGDLGMWEEVVTWKFYFGLAFTILTLKRVTIGCYQVDGGGGGGGGELFGGGVFGGSVVFSGDGVGNEVRGVVCGVACGVVCGVVKALISMMIVRVPEKDRWCGARGKFVRWKGVRVTKASKRTKLYKKQGEKKLAQNAFDRASCIDPLLALHWACMSADMSIRQIDEDENSIEDLNVDAH